MKNRSGTKHQWSVIGGYGDWEMCECKRCGRNEIPSPFFFMWSDVLRWIRPERYGCPAPADPDVRLENVGELLFHLYQPHGTRGSSAWRELPAEQQDYWRQDARAILGLLDAVERKERETMWR